MHAGVGIGKKEPNRDRLARQVGAYFRTLRQQQGLTQAQLAELASGQSNELSRGAVSAIERGEHFPGLLALSALSDALHVSPIEIIERVRLQTATSLDLTGVSQEELMRRGEQALWSGKFREALEAYDAMYQRLILDPPEGDEARRLLRARVEINRAVALRRCSALQAAKVSAERGIELSGGRDDLQAEAYMVLASLQSHEGLTVLARDAAASAIRLSEGGPAKLQARAWSQMGNVLHRGRLFEEALQAFVQARPLARKAKAWHDAIKIEGGVGACLMELGRMGQARGRFVRAVALARKWNDSAAEAFWIIEIGWVDLHHGETGKARECVEEALRLARPADQALTVFRAEWLSHKVSLTLGRSDRRRLQRLKKLFARVKEHKGLRAIQEFEREVLQLDPPHEEVE